MSQSIVIGSSEDEEIWEYKSVTMRQKSPRNASQQRERTQCKSKLKKHGKSIPSSKRTVSHNSQSTEDSFTGNNQTGSDSVLRDHNLNKESRASIRSVRTEEENEAKYSRRISLARNRKVYKEKRILEVKDSLNTSVNGTIKTEQQKGSISTGSLEANGCCPICQMPFIALQHLQTPENHVTICLADLSVGANECPDGPRCWSFDPSHYSEYKHSVLAQTRSGLTDMGFKICATSPLKDEDNVCLHNSPKQDTDKLTVPGGRRCLAGKSASPSSGAGYHSGGLSQRSDTQSLDTDSDKDLSEMLSDALGDGNNGDLDCESSRSSAPKKGTGTNGGIACVVIDSGDEVCSSEQQLHERGLKTPEKSRGSQENSFYNLSQSSQKKQENMSNEKKRKSRESKGKVSKLEFSDSPSKPSAILQKSGISGKRKRKNREGTTSENSPKTKTTRKQKEHGSLEKKQPSVMSFFKKKMMMNSKTDRGNVKSDDVPNQVSMNSLSRLTLQAGYVEKNLGKGKHVSQNNVDDGSHIEVSDDELLEAVDQFENGDCVVDNNKLDSPVNVSSGLKLKQSVLVNQETDADSDSHENFDINNWTNKVRQFVSESLTFPTTRSNTDSNVPTLSDGGFLIEDDEEDATSPEVHLPGSSCNTRTIAHTPENSWHDTHSGEVSSNIRNNNTEFSTKPPLKRNASEILMASSKRPSPVNKSASAPSIAIATGKPTSRNACDILMANRSKQNNGHGLKKKETSSEKNNASDLNVPPPAQSTQDRDNGQQWNRKCPFYKKIPDTRFTVDAFRYGDVPDCSAYFLTHFHYDHYMGLKKDFKNRMFCSPVTANLVKAKIRVPPQYIHPIPLNTSTVIEGTQVTFLEANHCPGAVMILFRLKNGRTVLHTGDFRASIAMETYPALLGVNIHSLYLDTTYCDPTYSFPAQEDVINFGVKLAQKAREGNPHTLIVCGSYSIGKEQVFTAIADALNCKISVTRDKKSILDCLEDPELKKKITLNWNESGLHVVPMNKLNLQGLEDHLSTNGKQYNSVLALEPTGWTFSKKLLSLEQIKPKLDRGRIKIYGIPYSEHSSFLEMKRFVQHVRPDKILPTVNNGNVHSRRKMEVIFKSWMDEIHQKTAAKKKQEEQSVATGVR